MRYKRDAQFIVLREGQILNKEVKHRNSRKTFKANCGEDDKGRYLEPPEPVWGDVSLPRTF